MKNFKPDDKGYKYLFEIPKEDLSKFKSRRTHIRIKLDYDLGGMNYFSGTQNPRSYKLYFKPVGVNGQFIESTFLSGNQFEEGYYVNVGLTNRFNKKRLIELAEFLDPNLDEFGMAYLNQNNMVDVIKMAALKNGFKILNETPEDKPDLEKPYITSKMKMMTKEIIEKLPAMGSTTGKDPKSVDVIVKFFDPAGSWDWYVIEGEATGEKIKEGAFKDEDDYLFFGYVKGIENELGYFALRDISVAKHNVAGLRALPVERDRHFKGTLFDVMDKS